ncbi:MAG TPA: cytochrome P460 family protein, partial [Steroidobacteraceae bacterium]
MFQHKARAIGYLGTLGSCVALVAVSLYVARSEAQSAKQGQAHAGAANSKNAVPLFSISIFPGYRDWKLISVAHEEGKLNDIRAVLGNDVAIKAYREGKLPFPDG